MYSIFENLLKSRGLRVADVTRATGIKSSTFTDWKKGRYVPKHDKLVLIADFFDVSLEYLLTGKESNSVSLSDRERNLLHTLRMLNDDGIDDVLDYADTLVRSGKYKKQQHHPLQTESNVA